MGDFTGFRFGNIHSKDLNLIVVSQSSRYDKNLLPNPTNYTLKVPGGDGNYYFGQTYESREINVNVAFDNVSENNFRQIQQLFSNDKQQDLVFDELPYKTFKAKIKSKPEFKVLCFTDKTTGERVYKGEGTLNFICFQPYAYGLNKYVVRAADYYKCLTPKQILSNISQKNYNNQLTGLIKDHYNVKENLHTPWKGGFPTIEQVQNGELFFDDDTALNRKKLLIDVREYWDNVPEWQSTAKLLTTPTLDFDQELIYMPQYSQVNYYNMDTGLNKQNAMIGSRILVYNPGDIPIDFELKLGNLSSGFRSNLAKYKFRISRYNVQRLTIEQAVDWTGLKTFKPEDNEKYKYGTRYFTIAEPNKDNQGLVWGEVKEDENTDWKFEPSYRQLKSSHPNHAYIVEPIPREKLGYFIRLFYHQSSLLNHYSNILDFDKGMEMADRYEELYEKCITDDERFELYWETLKIAILEPYELANRKILANTEYQKDIGFLNDEYTIDDFIYDYIYNPPEYRKEKAGLKYGQFNLNIGSIPDYYTYDYLDISNKEFDKILDVSDCGCDLDYEVNRLAIKPLTLDTHRRMLYNKSIPVWKSDRTYDGIKWQEQNPDLLDNFYKVKQQKILFNDNIEKGTWFKLPPGWSLIDISPIVDEDAWGGKTWLHAASFKWGTNDEKERKWFNKVYRAAAEVYLAENCPQHIIEQYNGSPIEDSDKLEFFKSLELSDLEQYMQFRRWYVEPDNDYENAKKGDLGENRNKKGTIKGLGYEMLRRKTEQAEYNFLKLLAEYWRINQFDENELPNGDIDDWWWYASNYIWANFPPLYWGYADLLNKAQIEYTPLFF